MTALVSSTDQVGGLVVALVCIAAGIWILGRALLEHEDRRDIADQEREFAIEPRCPGGCHSGPFADFDHYCDRAGIQPGEEGPAFGAWMNALSGWDGQMGRVVPEQRGGEDR